MRVLIVSRTRMREGRVCVGAHDLADFRSLRLYKHDGTYLNETDPVAIGQIWDLQYRPKSDLEPPHVEDVIVAGEGAARVGREPNLSALILQRDEIWRAPDELFEGRLHFTEAGSAYVPADGPLPSRSTGYWLLDMPLQRQQHDGKTRYVPCRRCRSAPDQLCRHRGAEGSDPGGHARTCVPLAAVRADGASQRLLAPALRLVLGVESLPREVAGQ